MAAKQILTPDSPLWNEGEVSPGSGLSRDTEEWREFFSLLSDTSTTLRQSGTTTQRPTKNLWTGRPYFDTTLGKPIWYKTSGWVDGTGASV